MLGGLIHGRQGVLPMGWANSGAGQNPAHNAQILSEFFTRAKQDVGRELKKSASPNSLAEGKWPSIESLPWPVRGNGAESYMWTKQKHEGRTNGQRGTTGSNNDSKKFPTGTSRPTILSNIVKEKTIAARRSGVKTIIFPAGIRRDFDELSDNVKEGLEVHFVEDYSQIFDLAFGNKDDAQTLEPHVNISPPHCQGMNINMGPGMRNVAMVDVLPKACQDKARAAPCRFAFSSNSL
ncbi:Lon protease like, mitochondrial [Apostasia shenzhenica]|uniref:Lon protease like, mitochondrial n=1 Tax=Apostasia shenzhenica TaxID=1088818 RepID=A0A2I0AP49_9ASPA|nr:Lon protease like, mitochondrial [Apostasia shenzhenica]